MHISIKCRFTDKILFEGEYESTKHAVEAAVKSYADLGGANLRDANLGGANLGGAYLRDANLGGAYLGGANLRDANLGGANLGGADLGGAYLGGANLGGANLGGASLGGASLGGAYLRSAYLRDANLRDANLGGANLGGAYLGGANLGGADLGGGEKLIGDRPAFSVGPIGSRCAYLTSFLTDKGIKIQAGCFFGTVEEFRNAVVKEHGESVHAREYACAIDMLIQHHTLWTPVADEAAA